jgi:hypothetical protein
VHKPVLLTELRGKRKRQMHFARGYEDDLGPESGHMALATEVLTHQRFVSGIFGYHGFSSIRKWKKIETVALMAATIYAAAGPAAIATTDADRVV